MWQLVLDASTSCPFILLCKDCKIEQFKQSNELGSSYLIKAIAQLISQGRLPAKQIATIFVGAGPGSFIGLRASLTIAKMFKLSFGSSIFFLPVMQAISLPKEGKIGSLIDGKARGVFLATHEKNEGKTTLLQTPSLLPLAEAQRSLQEIHLCSFDNETVAKKLNLPVEKAKWDLTILQQLVSQPNNLDQLTY